MGVMSEFKEFAMRGNVVDMAVGLVIGAAFGKIVSAFVDNIVTPPLGLLIGGVNFEDLAIVLKPGDVSAGIEPVLMQYGLFVQSLVDFIIVAFAIFVAIRAMNRLQRKRETEPESAPLPSEEVQLLTQIRDGLASRSAAPVRGEV